MASEDVFSGPISESVPSSISAFAHRRRSRAESNASFTFFNQEEIETHSIDTAEDALIIDDDDDGESFDPYADPEEDEDDLEAARRLSPVRTRSPRLSRDSGENNPLLQRSDTGGTDFSFNGGTRRTSQRIYIVTEDLTIVVGGFRTSKLGMTILTFLSIMTLGLAYLILRWVPKWRIRLVGKTATLKDCEWVVIEVRQSPRSIGCADSGYRVESMERD